MQCRVLRPSGHPIGRKADEGRPLRLDRPGRERELAARRVANIPGGLEDDVLRRFNRDPAIGRGELQVPFRGFNRRAAIRVTNEQPPATVADLEATLVDDRARAVPEKQRLQRAASTLRGKV